MVSITCGFTGLLQAQGKLVRLYKPDHHTTRQKKAARWLAMGLKRSGWEKKEGNGHIGISGQKTGAGDDRAWANPV
jgi:hypothetical protein